MIAKTYCRYHENYSARGDIYPTVRSSWSRSQGTDQTPRTVESMNMSSAIASDPAREFDSRVTAGVAAGALREDVVLEHRHLLLGSVQERHLRLRRAEHDTRSQSTRPVQSHFGTKGRSAVVKESLETFKVHPEQLPNVDLCKEHLWLPLHGLPSMLGIIGPYSVWTYTSICGDCILGHDRVFLQDLRPLG